jgi:excisionase family DNA binding protein
MEPTTQPEFMTPAEVSAHLRISKSGIYHLIASRFIAVYRIGRRLRLKRSDVEKYVEGRYYATLERKRI